MEKKKMSLALQIFIALVIAIIVGLILGTKGAPFFGPGNLVDLSYILQ